MSFSRGSLLRKIYFIVSIVVRLPVPFLHFSVYLDFIPALCVWNSRAETIAVGSECLIIPSQQTLAITWLSWFLIHPKPLNANIKLHFTVNLNLKKASSNFNNSMAWQTDLKRVGGRNQSNQQPAEVFWKLFAGVIVRIVTRVVLTLWRPPSVMWPPTGPHTGPGAGEQTINSGHGRVGGRAGWCQY